MLAGAITGALFKSTGECLLMRQLLIPLSVHLLSSGCEASIGSSYYCFSIRGNVELGKDTRLSTLWCLILRCRCTIYDYISTSAA
jgi:hypothetical protein